MKLKTHLAALAICATVPLSVAAAPSCDKNRTSDLGGLAPSGLMGFSSSFSSEGTYLDCFTFRLASPADSLSGALQHDNKGIDLKSVALYRGNVRVGEEDTSPLLFSFGSLAASGDAVYTLQVVSDVTKYLGNDGNDKVKKMGKEEEKGKVKDKDNARVVYIGKITTVAAAVPEPAAYALAIVGLIVVGAGALRRKPH